MVSVCQITSQFGMRISGDIDAAPCLLFQSGIPLDPFDGVDRPAAGPRNEPGLPPPLGGSRQCERRQENRSPLRHVLGFLLE